MRDINEYFEYLYTLERVGMKYNLTNITTLLKALGNPHLKFKSIHIAGTNGKGATASFIASILKEQGLKTGLFTSPHLLKFNERIRINNKPVSDKYIKSFLDENIKLINKVKPSFFEVNTALAFKYFAENKVDAAVIECGLGGRLDSTNTLKPEVCVITQIGMDHMQYLGKSLKDIAKEKAGILKYGSNVVISDNNKPLRALLKNAAKWQEKIFIDEFLHITEIKSGKGKTNFSFVFKPVYHKLKLAIPLAGKYHAVNAAAAFLAVSIFCRRTNNVLYVKNIINGLKNIKTNTFYRGRLDTVKSKGQTYIFDVSHNPEGIKNALEELKPTGKDVIVFGIMADKDYKKAVKQLIMLKSCIIFTKPSYKRAAEPEILLKLAEKNSRKVSSRKVSSRNNIYEAIAEAHYSVKTGGRIIFLGSFFLVSDAIKALKLEKHFS